jgi:hypothetical protein
METSKVNQNTPSIALKALLGGQNLDFTLFSKNW